MVDFAYSREEWLNEVLELPNGIPSHDTFNRVLSMLDPKALKECLDKEGKALLGTISGKQLAIDGKKVKGVSPGSKGNKGLWILNAWVCENRLCIGQRKVNNKSNEIRAIPKLLEELAIEGALVSIDAIGCQQAIARQIMSQKGDYLLSVKNNQKDLLSQIKDSFSLHAKSLALEGRVDLSWEYQRGRYEERSCQILPARQMLLAETLEQWEGVKTLIKIEASRRTKKKTSRETRYYISSVDGQPPKYFNRATRGHWGIENHLHWHLDVTFNEDGSRARKGFAPQNLSILRKIALHRLSLMPDKRSIKRRRFVASLDNEYLIDLISW